MKIRPAATSDAEGIGTLIVEFQQYLRGLGDQTDFRFGPTEYLRDGFGNRPAFTGLVAETDEAIVGYALYHDGYDTDRGRRVIHLIDLYVQESSRRRGIGQALMKRLVDTGRDRGAEVIIWSVYGPNVQAARFYEQLGARYVADLRWMVLDI